MFCGCDKGHRITPWMFCALNKVRSGRCSVVRSVRTFCVPIVNSRRKMEIVNSNCATLSNYEVLKHLQKLKDSKRKHKGQLATITYETIRYLEHTPCNEQSPESIKECLKALAPFNLNKSELLMIVNSPPTSALEIQLMIEESEERLTEEQVGQILEIIAKQFPHVIKKEDEENEEENND